MKTKAKYTVSVGKYRPKTYGYGRFGLGSASTINEALKKVRKSSTRHGDTYSISKIPNDGTVRSLIREGSIRVTKDNKKQLISKR